MLGLVQGLLPHFLFTGTLRHGRFCILVAQAVLILLISKLAAENRKKFEEDHQ